MKDHNIFNIKDISLEKMFLYIAIPLGVAYIFLILPNFKPDEDQHIWRAYDVSQGNLVSNEISYPRDYRTYGTLGMTNYQQYKDALLARTDYKDVISSTSAAGGYYFMNYIPAALGVVLSRLLGLNVTIAALLSRTMNYMCFLFMGFLSIRLLPVGKFVMFVYLLNPMMLYMASAVSADVLINCFSLLYIAYASKLIYEHKEINIKNILLLLCLLWIPVNGKIVYLPLVFLLMPLVFYRLEHYKFFENKFEIIKKYYKVLLPASVSICFLAYLIFRGIMLEKVSDAAAIAFFHPTTLFRYFVQTMKVYGKMYITSFSGSMLNWYHLPNKTGSAELYLIILFLASFLAEKKEYSMLVRVYYFLLGIGLIAGIYIGCFVAWTDPSSGLILGVQGRYFIPCILLVCLALINKKFQFHFNEIYVRALYMLLLICVNVMTLYVNITFFML